VATSTTYDANNNVSSLTAGGVTTSFTRDGNGNITNQTDQVGSQTFEYNADDAQKSHSFTIGSTTSSETDNRNNEDQLVMAAAIVPLV